MSLPFFVYGNKEKIQELKKPTKTKKLISTSLNYEAENREKIGVLFSKFDITHSETISFIYENAEKFKKMNLILVTIIIFLKYTVSDPTLKKIKKEYDKEDEFGKFKEFFKNESKNIAPGVLRANFDFEFEIYYDIIDDIIKNIDM